MEPEQRLEQIEKRQDAMAHTIFWLQQEMKGTREFLQIERVSPEELEQMEDRVKQTRDYRG